MRRSSRSPCSSLLALSLAVHRPDDGRARIRVAEQKKRSWFLISTFIASERFRTNLHRPCDTMATPINSSFVEYGGNIFNETLLNEFNYS
jgi:hypothetical protein